MPAVQRASHIVIGERPWDWIERELPLHRLAMKLI
jgi:hypothetical protein